MNTYIFVFPKGFEQEHLDALIPEGLTIMGSDSNMLMTQGTQELIPELINVLPLMIADMDQNVQVLAAPFYHPLVSRVIEKTLGQNVSSWLWFADLYAQVERDEEIIQLTKTYFSAISPQAMDCAQMYLNCGCHAGLSAQALYMHRNTFHYQLKRFTDMSQLDLKNYHHARWLSMVFKNR